MSAQTLLKGDGSHVLSVFTEYINLGYGPGGSHLDAGRDSIGFQPVGNIAAAHQEREQETHHRNTVTLYAP